MSISQISLQGHQHLVHILDRVTSMEQSQNINFGAIARLLDKISDVQDENREHRKLTATPQRKTLMMAPERVNCDPRPSRWEYRSRIDVSSWFLWLAL